MFLFDQTDNKSLPIAETDKVCSKCGEAKPLTEYRKRNDKRRPDGGGYWTHCNECHKTLPSRSKTRRQGERRKIAEGKGKTYRAGTQGRTACPGAYAARRAVSLDRLPITNAIQVWRYWLKEKAPDWWLEKRMETEAEQRREYAKRYQAIRYKENPEYERARVKAYKHANPDKVAEWGDRRWKRAAALNDGTLTTKETRALYAAAKSCPYCGDKLTPATATLDHIVPLSKGGAHSLINVVTCCGSCNSRKLNKNFADWCDELVDPYKARALRLYRKRYGSPPSQAVMPLLFGVLPRPRALGNARPRLFFRYRT